jgi:hypothetical protein
MAGIKQVPPIETLDELIAALQAVRETLPGETPVMAFDTDEAVSLGRPTVLPMWEDPNGDLHQDIEDIEDDADLADCVSEPGERAVAIATQVVAIRCGISGMDYQ